MRNLSIDAAVVTVSDTRMAGDDPSGDKLAELLAAAGAEIIVREYTSDDLEQIKKLVGSLAGRADINLICTTGGTGLGPRDNTPEATRAIIQREAAGIAEAMRRETAVKTPMAMLSRGVCGICNNTLIINLPGSPKAVEECFEVIRPVLVHAIQLISGVTSHENS